MAICSSSAKTAQELLEASEAAIDAIAKVDNVITPFPGGIVRSGSKVGAKYKGMFASTNDAFCPTLRGAVKSELSPDSLAVLEIVIDGLTSSAVADAMRAGLKALTAVGAGRASPASRPATTAANSANTTIT